MWDRTEGTSLALGQALTTSRTARSQPSCCVSRYPSQAHPDSQQASHACGAQVSLQALQAVQRAHTTLLLQPAPAARIRATQKSPRCGSNCSWQAHLGRSPGAGERAQPADRCSQVAVTVSVLNVKGRPSVDWDVRSLSSSPRKQWSGSRAVPGVLSQGRALWHQLAGRIRTAWPHCHCPSVFLGRSVSRDPLFAHSQSCRAPWFAGRRPARGPRPGLGLYPSLRPRSYPKSAAWRRGCSLAPAWPGLTSWRSPTCPACRR